ncbi:MAG TPA: helix-turn-helix domain-containing protein, partial [Caldilineaceae bacterium]|nr:helix-turn-helix domain-containing protein [Caldilineaceae bacterium]
MRSKLPGAGRGRFHLLQNLRGVLQRLLERYSTEIRQAAEASRALPSSLPTVQTIVEPPVAIQSAPPPPVQAVATMPTLSHYEQYRQQRRTKRVARYEEVRQLHAQGFSLRQIAKQLHLHRSTVRRFVLADQFPEQATRCKRPSKLDRHLAYLEQQLVAGRDNAMQLWRELRNEHGYTGSRALVSRWVAQHRSLELDHPLGAAKRQR